MCERVSRRPGRTGFSFPLRLSPTYHRHEVSVSVHTSRQSPQRERSTGRRERAGKEGSEESDFFFFLSEHASGRPVRARFSPLRAPPPTRAPSDFAEQARLISSAQGARPHAASRPRARGLLLAAVWRRHVPVTQTDFYDRVLALTYIARSFSCRRARARTPPAAHGTTHRAASAARVHKRPQLSNDVGLGSN